MPRLSVDGQAVMGVAGVITSVDGSVPAPLAGSSGGGWDWLDDDDTIVGQADLGLGGGYRFYSLVLSTSTLTELDTAGASQVAAGGGVWARFVAGAGADTSNGLSLPLAGRGSVDRDGTYAVTTVYATGGGVSVYSSTPALLHSVTTVIGAGQVMVRDGMLTWPSATGWPLLDSATGQAIPGYLQAQNVYTLIPLLLGTMRLVVEYDNAANQWTIRRFDQATGLLVNSSGTETYGMDARIVGGQVRLAWSTDQGESAAALVTLDVDMTTGTTVRGTVSGGGIVYAAGPTLTGTTISLATAPGTYLPTVHPMVDRQGRITEPWLKALAAIGNGVQRVQTTVNATPTALPLADADYLVGTVPVTLPEARAVTDTASVEWDLTQPNEAAADLTATGVTADTYGDASHIPQVTVDAQGRITAATEFAVSTGSYIPLVDGSEPPVFITDGAGHLILVAYP